jgi:hypothetical protein
MGGRSPLRSSKSLLTVNGRSQVRIPTRQRPAIARPTATGIIQRNAYKSSSEGPYVYYWHVGQMALSVKGDYADCVSFPEQQHCH